MRINRLTASFGKFNNESISFHPGLNVIYAPNEGGKSTWCAFIRAMLYGIDSSERARAGKMPDKLKYMPWSGNSMEGSMEITSGLSDITLIRTTRTRNAPMQEFKAVYTGTSTEVDGLSGSNAGIKLTGVGEEVFKRSAFVGQGAAELAGSVELEKRIQSILSTGEEELSYTEADSRLKAWQRMRRSGRHGLIPETESEIDRTQRKLEDIAAVCADIEDKQTKLEESRARCMELEAEVTEERKYQRRRVLDELGKTRAEARAAEERYNLALEELNICREELGSSAFGRTDVDSADEMAESDSAELEELSGKAKIQNSPWLFIALFMLALAGAVVYEKLFQHIALIIASGVLCVCMIIALIRYLCRRREILALRGRMQSILIRYGITSPEEIADRLEQHHAIWTKLRKAEEKEKTAGEESAAAEKKLYELEGKITEELDFVSGSSDAAKLGRMLSEERAKAAALSEQIAGMKGVLAGLGDRNVLSDSLLCLKAEAAQLENEYDAIQIAMDALKEADTEIQSRFSPELGRIAGEYMAFVTNGKYENVLLGRNFSAMAKARDDAVARQSDYLSTGTTDLLYLAVRLAVCELALPAGEVCPLIIDDALVNLDETRYSQALSLLAEIAKTRQVIFFTCRK